MADAVSSIAISGASGGIASRLIPTLTAEGHQVMKLVRGDADGVDEIAWSAATGAVDRLKLSRCEAIVHLAGMNIAQRWTTRRMREIWQSRVDATRRLCESLAQMSDRPGTLVCASATGFYGDRHETELDETSSRGDGFAAELCEAWERATDPARDAGVRVVNLRLGVVIAGDSGAVKKLIMPTKLGLAGRLGSGEQWMPWIAMDDVVGVIHEAIVHDDWHGPINAVTGSVRQRDFIETLGRVLHRPTLVPMPAAVVSLIFGQMGREMLLASARVVPKRLERAGFTWRFSELETALRAELLPTLTAPAPRSHGRARR